MENQNEPIQEPQLISQVKPQKSHMPIVLIILGIVVLIFSLYYSYGSLNLISQINIVYSRLNETPNIPSFSILLGLIVSLVIPITEIFYGFRLRKIQNTSKPISDKQKVIAVLLILSPFIFALLLMPLYLLSVIMPIYNLSGKIDNSQTPTTISQLSPTPDETANWKIYQNNQYGFSFQYPPTYQVFKEGITKDGDTEIFQAVFMPIDQNLIKAFGVGVYVEKKIPNEKGLSDLEVINLLEDKTTTCDKSMSNGRERFLTLNCRQKLEPLEPEPEEGYPRESYFISPQRYLFFIEYLYNKNNQKLIDQILSTFKFTD